MLSKSSPPTPRLAETNLIPFIPHARTHTHTHARTQVKAILVNIFGGIVDCTTIANGIVAACREIQLRMPLVVRLEGVCVCV